MSPVQLAQLQASFEALQVKFVSLMRERADLLDLLEEHKLLLVTSAQRVEAMGGCLLCGIIGWKFRICGFLIIFRNSDAPPYVCTSNKIVIKCMYIHIHYWARIKVKHCCIFLVYIIFLCIYTQEEKLTFSTARSTLLLLLHNSALPDMCYT